MVGQRSCCPRCDSHLVFLSCDLGILVMESRKAEEVADILRSALQRLEGNNRNRNIAGSSSNRNETTERRELEASTSSRPNSSTYALSPTTYASTGAPSPSSTFAPSSSHAPDATRFGLFTSRTQISHSAAIARDFRYV